MKDTRTSAYTERLAGLQGARWKQVVDVQAPYRWLLQRIIGNRRTIDVGCGIGRLLRCLPEGSLGVDHNAHSVEHCRALGLDAVTVDELTQPRPEFDALVAGHLLEHLPPGAQSTLLEEYTPRLKDDALVVLICPQERGYASDATHLTYCDDAVLAEAAQAAGLVVEKQMSFPFPRPAGWWFTYNEFVTVARKPAGLRTGGDR